jgi:hypothetical protein
MTIDPATLIQNRNDLARVNEVMRHPKFVIPPALWEALPQAIIGPMVEKHPTGHPNAGEFKYKLRDRQRAQRLAIDLCRLQLMMIGKIEPTPELNDDNVPMRLPDDEAAALESVRSLPDADIATLAEAARMLDEIAKRQRLIVIPSTVQDATGSGGDGSR